MVMAGGGEPVPLYPIPTQTSGAFTGTGGDKGVYTRASGGTSYLGLLGATRSTSSSAYTGKSKKFTIPANSYVEFSVYVNSKSGTFTLYGLRVADSSSAFLGSGATMTSGNTYSYTTTTTDAVDIGEIGFKLQTSSGTNQSFDVTISLTVDGVRYI